MRLSSILDFDASGFTEAELAGLQTLADQCAKAKTASAIEAAGADLDVRRAEHREATRKAAARSRSLQVLFKLLIREVPRNLDDPDGPSQAVVL